MLGSVRYAPDGARAEDAIEAGASMLAAAEAGWEAVSTAVVAAAVAAVRQCWAGGWQPADLERIVRREASDASLVAVVVDAIAAEAARPPATRPTPDTRWADQLRTLGADVWWPSDAAYLDALAECRRASRFETAYGVLAALRVLARLPRITPLPSPPEPDRARSGPAGAAAARALGRIRGLLAKAEATDYAEEAEALSAKAQELMARHSIDAALLDRAHTAPGGQAGGPSAVRIGIEGPYEQAKALLLDAVAAANRCQAVWAADVGFSTLVGFAPDLEAAEMLYTSLLLQATAAMHRAGDDHHRALKEHGGTPVPRGRSRRTKDFRQTFLVAYADRIRDRLGAATEAATAAATAESAEAAPDLLPVLAARALAVEETTGTLFPDSAPVRLRGIRDAEGWHQGRAAADRARLGEE
ncbi:DUF2786 domain-containing protein [Streptomyces angustmyceticus]